MRATFVRYFSALIAMLFAAPAFADDVLYVSVAGEKRIAIYQVDSADGHLTRVGEVSTAGEPGALTTDPKRRFLFAALRSTGELAAFRIEAATGKLTHINTAPAGADPAHISVDREGKFLLTAYYVAGQVTVHTIADDGSLGKKPVQTVKTKEKAHAIVFDPRGLAVLIPHTGPNVIYALWWNGKSGEIADPSIGSKTFETPTNTGPRHLVFHPTLEIRGGFDCDAQVAYVVNEQGSSVTMYHAILNPINWLLESKQTLSTLPVDFKGTNACAEIRLHPSHRFLYASNRGHDSIVGFRVDKGTGELTSLGQTPTEKTPRYRVNEMSGTLQRTATYEVGKMPWWVMAVRLPSK
jgi:6-phosphogluconolactonase